MQFFWKKKSVKLQKFCLLFNVNFRQFPPISGKKQTFRNQEFWVRADTKTFRAGSVGGRF